MKNKISIANIVRDYINIRVDFEKTKSRIKTGAAILATAIVVGAAAYFQGKSDGFNEGVAMEQKAYQDLHMFDGMSFGVTNNNGNITYDLSARFGDEKIDFYDLEKITPNEDDLDSLAKTGLLAKRIKLYNTKMNDNNQLNIRTSANDCFLGVGISRMIINCDPSYNHRYDD